MTFEELQYVFGHFFALVFLQEVAGALDSNYRLIHGGRYQPPEPMLVRPQDLVAIGKHDQCRSIPGSQEFSRSQHGGSHRVIGEYGYELREHVNPRVIARVGKRRRIGPDNFRVGDSTNRKLSHSTAVCL